MAPNHQEIIMKTLNKNKISYDKVHDIFNVIDNQINGQHLGSSVIVPNICNIKSINFSNGFASTLASHYPNALNGYQVLSNNERKLGYCQIFAVGSSKSKEYQHKVYIANMMCQVGFNSKNNRSRNLNYAAMATCLNKINHFLKNHLNKDQQCEIRTHKYLVNYVGSDSKFVSYLLEDTFDNNITIHLN